MPIIYALAASLIVLVAGSALAALPGAVILRIAIWIYNKLVGGPGSPSSVPSPRFGKLAYIALNAIVIAAALPELLQFLRNPAVLGDAVPRIALLLGVLAALPIGFFALAGLLTRMLPTTFGRALLVSLFHWVITSVMIGGVIALALAVWAAR
jgi:hypothetical protein